MSAADHLSPAQSGKYQYHLDRSMGTDEMSVNVYKGNEQVGAMASLTTRAGASREIDYARVAKGHRAVVGTMLGIHQMLAQEAGVPLEASSYLSPHSSKLVRNLQGRGLVTGSLDAEPSNDMSFERPHRVSPRDREGARLNTATVNRGRSFIRQKLKESRRERQ